MSDQFCLQEVIDSFRLSLSDTKEVSLDHYVEGWRGLVKLLNSLGSVFGFISKDAVNKIDILVSLRGGPGGAHYVSLQSMVQYELQSELVDQKQRGGHPESGCRTLLRLHRALRWLQLFLEGLRVSGEDGSPPALCSQAYHQSLAQHHPWLIRTAAGVAFRMLPSRASFLQLMNAGPPEQAVLVLGEALPLLGEVYSITEELYAQHNLLNLP
ncbi:LOW QUALITY PROTEIN: ceramide-1-phosphate transfer protein [Eleginops maclovinus]|uniref:LOW QUALITY PROTEIN: ceramide-1-phosphate transfer protein n=1 Tax=Eleginops maclovinus TaxID=56733 RepID=UPI0030802B3B